VYGKHTGKLPIWNMTVADASTELRKISEHSLRVKFLLMQPLI